MYKVSSDTIIHGLDVLSLKSNNIQYDIETTEKDPYSHLAKNDKNLPTKATWTLHNTNITRNEIHSMNNNRILQLSKYHRTTSITARITTSKQSWIKEHFNHLQQIETKRPQLIFIGDSLVQGFKRYHHT